MRSALRTVLLLITTDQTHDVHHPIAVEKYYDEQKEAASERAESYRANRLPKFLKHFENVLSTNSEVKVNGESYLVGSSTTTADLTLFHVIQNSIVLPGGC